MQGETKRHWKYGTMMPLKALRYTKGDEALLVAYHKAGKTTKQLMRILGRSYGSVRRKLHELRKEK